VEVVVEPSRHFETRSASKHAAKTEVIVKERERGVRNVMWICSVSKLASAVFTSFSSFEC
jgi:hypothetical protein